VIFETEFASQSSTEMPLRKQWHPERPAPASNAGAILGQLLTCFSALLVDNLIEFSGYSKFAAAFPQLVDGASGAVEGSSACSPLVGSRAHSRGYRIIRTRRKKKTCFRPISPISRAA
jgi:hypothetical protein